MNEPRDEWYLLPKGERKRGPFSTEELKEHLASNAFSAGLRIRKGSDAEWCPWSNITGRYPLLVEEGVVEAAQIRPSERTPRECDTCTVCLKSSAPIAGTKQFMLALRTSYSTEDSGVVRYVRTNWRPITSMSVRVCRGCRDGARRASAEIDRRGAPLHLWSAAIMLLLVLLCTIPAIVYPELRDDWSVRVYVNLLLGGSAAGLAYLLFAWRMLRSSGKDADLTTWKDAATEAFRKEHPGVYGSSPTDTSRTDIRYVFGEKEWKDVLLQAMARSD